MATPDEFFGTSPQIPASDFFQGGEIRRVVPETEEEKLGFAQRFGEDLSKRKLIAEEITQATSEGEQSTAEGILQMVGKVGVGGVFDFIQQGLTSLARGASAITPDPLEERLVESATNVGRTFLNTTIGQLGLKAAQEGMPAYEKFAEENPRAARNIESVVNIGLLAAPVSRSAKPSVIQTTQERRLLERGAESLRAGAEVQEARIRTSFIDDLISPKKSAKVRLEETARTVEEGALRTKKVSLSRGEQIVAREIETIPGVTESKTLQGNLNAIRTELGVEAETLLAQLQESRVLIPRVETRRALEAAGKSLEGSPTLTGDAAKTASRLVDSAMKFVNENPGTSAGLLKARQQFDKFLTTQKRNALGDVPMENALTIAAKEIRQTMNQIIATKNPSAGVRTSLDRQSNMFRAMDNIGPKAADEAGNVVVRAWQNAMSVLPFRGQFNQLMATGFGIGGLGASARFAPVFTGMVALGGIAYFGGKAVLSSAAKKATASLLTQIDKAIKVATNPDMLKQLRADRALLLKLIEGSEE